MERKAGVDRQLNPEERCRRVQAAVKNGELSGFWDYGCALPWMTSHIINLALQEGHMSHAMSCVVRVEKLLEEKYQLITLCPEILLIEVYWKEITKKLPVIKQLKLFLDRES